MELESQIVGPKCKVPILKLGEYEMWVIRIKQYFQIQDYALWELIENGDSWVSVPHTSQENGIIVTKMSTPATVEEKTNKKNDVKAKEQIHEDDLEAKDLKWQLSLLSVRAKKYYHRTSKKIFINATDIARYDKSKQGNHEDISSKAMLAIDSVGFDWSDMAEEQVQSNMALRHFNTEVYHSKTCSKTCLKNYETLKKQCDDLLVKLNESEFKAATYKREKEGIDFKIKKFDKASKDLDQLLGSQITDKSKKGLGYSAVPPPHPLIYNRPNKLDLSYSGLDEFKEPEFKGYGPENSKQESNVVCEKESENSKENSDESLVEEQVTQDQSSFVESSPNVDKETVFPANKKHFDENCLSPCNTVKLVNTAPPPKQQFHSANQDTFSKQAQSTAKRPFYKQTSLTRRSVHEAKRHYYTGRHYAVNTARSYSGQVNAVRGKPQHDDKGFVDSGCSRHMTGNIAYLSDFKQFDGGYVAFGGGAYGGKITGKGTLKTDNLDFEDYIRRNSQDCIVMPIWKDTSYFDSPTKDVDNDEPKTADDAQKQVENALNNENAEQERFTDDSNTKYVNAVGKQINTASPDVNTGSLKLNAIGPSVSTASPNEEDSTEEELEVDLGNITNSYIVPTTPNTRIHKDHPINNVIGEVHSTVQTRRMSKPTSEQGFFSDMYE
ncbi:hypothetical protein Tco_0116530 [Tanacetum coccineum]